MMLEPTRKVKIVASFLGIMIAVYHLVAGFSQHSLYQLTLGVLWAFFTWVKGTRPKLPILHCHLSVNNP